MSNADIALMAHLMRRAGFGASRDELEQRNARGYENVVEDLLNPGAANSMPDDVIRRYHVDMAEMRELNSAGAYWLYRMVTTDNPLEEKMALFWHSLFATGYSKLNQARALMNQIDTFRRNAMGDFRTMLVELSKDPAMIIWLDNNDNHKGDINENYGRELLELFSMGIGNYTEDDVKECARAFTGWTLGNAEYMATRASRDSIWPYSRISWHFQYRDHDHDDGEKTFLGETGNFNGEDIIDIIVRQDATARFICTRLFQFFAADEVDDGRRGGHRRDDGVLLCIRLRNPLGAADAVQLRLLQVGGGEVRPGQGAGGVGSGRGQVGRHLPGTDFRRRPAGPLHHVHGTGHFPAAQRGRLARRRGVD